MPSVRSGFLTGTLTPFLYPAFTESTLLAVSRRCPLHRRFPPQSRCSSTATEQSDYSRLDPTPDDYSLTPFADRAILTLEAGAGGHGCVSFLREMYTPEGPANGGDGGSGGNIYIQAVRGETSLHKLARRRLIKGGRGRNGQGKVKGGERGADVLIKVPVGTIVREIQRHDPVDILLQEAERAERERGRAEANGDVVEEDGYKKDRWLVYPGTVPTELNRMKFPQLPKPRKSHLAALEPQSPLWLDLDKHMETPMLLAAGAMGGLGNPNFMTPFNNRPKMATRGEEGLKISVQLELKILADLGLVGLPNAGKSTLLRALSNSRARVGNWAFTTLQPNVGTVVLDNHKGRPLVTKRNKHGELRESFTIADVPGLIEDAHLDKGLGLGFLRHVERAAVLAFVIDLNAGDAVQALKLLWREVSEYESLRGKELNAETERRTVLFRPVNMPEPKRETDMLDTPDLDPSIEPLPFLTSEPISAKPWLVVATKADLEGTQENYEKLRKYLEDVRTGAQPHPSGRANAWKRDVSSVPISAIHAHGVEAIPQMVMDLLDD
ncbi:P-loop containing nucleoside triphosphate hydrolase protein [Boeremia exigua]|uniref:P-loop containing nucleoside triphosphate hydrolase protein n=1 Tax=Boeremia exigua TaxID=749465 RepID=UPI001E8D7C0D|nr:P-loop containing nucleoside triphosphate hydrolase protein [Boeremia exigua]KAH6633389.1 P-loop containing nucleoside triphosphate hydrolase protein [Boeremia exigua]